MRLVYGLALIFLCPVFALGQVNSKTSSAVSEDEQELSNLVVRWQAAARKGDADTVAGFLADEFSVVGGELSKSDYLEGVKEEPAVYESNDIESLQIEIYGDAAVVTALHSFKLKVKKGKRPAPTKYKYFMTVWVKRNGRWQSVKACIRPIEMLPIITMPPRP
jgi:ketosteroid isomerase-like protein